MAPQGKLNEPLIDQLVQLIEAGNYIQVAAAAVGINPKTYYDWKRRGEKVRHHLEETEQEMDPAQYGDDLLPANVTPADWMSYKMLCRVEEAEARAEAFAVLAVKKQMPEQWTAAMTYLERRHPTRWRRRQTIEAVDAGQGGIDEQALIEDPAAVELLHNALERLAVTEGEVVEEARLLEPGDEPSPS